MIKYDHEGVCYWQAAGVLIPAVMGLIGMHSANSARQKADEERKRQLALAGPAAEAGKQLVGQGQGAIGQGLGYYSSMLADPRTATAPEQNRISSMYAGQAANMRNQYGRGGGGPGAAEILRDQQRRATEGVIQQGRPMAAGALTGAGLGAVGAGFQGQGLGAGIYSNVFNQGMDIRRYQQGAGEGIGNAFFGAYQNYLLGQAMKQPGTTPSGGGNGGFDFSKAYQGQQAGQPNMSAGYPGMPGSNLYAGSYGQPTPNSGSSGSP